MIYLKKKKMYVPRMKDNYYYFAQNIAENKPTDDDDVDLPITLQF